MLNCSSQRPSLLFILSCIFAANVKSFSGTLQNSFTSSPSSFLATGLTLLHRGRSSHQSTGGRPFLGWKQLHAWCRLELQLIITLISRFRVVRQQLQSHHSITWQLPVSWLHHWWAAHHQGVVRFLDYGPHQRKLIDMTNLMQKSFCV